MTQLSVTLVASTKLEPSENCTNRFAIEDATPYVAHQYTDLVRPIDELSEVAGRGCYESYHRPNEATRSNEAYQKHILDVGHFSVIEHGSATFFIAGVSRALLAELSRHRHFSFSVLSQRYVDSSEAKVITPPLFDGQLELALANHNEASQNYYEQAVDRLIQQGYSRKEARGAARAFLPEATETKIFLTGNMRAFMEFIQKRNIDGADIEIRLLAQELLRHLKRVAPNTFQNMSVEA